MSENVKDNSDKQIVITEKNLEILITKFIPTSQYFERSFQALQIQIDGLHEGQKDLKREIDRRTESLEKGQKDLKREIDRRAESLEKGQQAVKEALELQIKSVRDSQEELKVDIDRRFEQVDRRFEQVDKRFEQIDKRFEQIDKRFEQIDVKLDKILERVDTKIDAGLRENRAMTIRLFTFAMVFAAISMAGLLAKMTGLF